MRDVIIFGAGRYGSCAWFYFRDRCNIVGFIDNNRNLWGKELNGLQIFSPDILREHKYHVLIANSQHADEIKRQLFQQYGITSVMIFCINFYSEDLDGEESVPDSCDDLIVEFKGNLGNQMFQYTICKIFEKQGKTVSADLSFYASVMQTPGVDHATFRLDKVFPHVQVKRAIPSSKRYFMERKGQKDVTGLCYTYKEMLSKQIFDDSWILNMERGYLCGYFQSYRYPEMVQGELAEDFCFREGEKKLHSLIWEMEHGNFVGVHVRRGDYLSPKNKEVFGNPCDVTYYKRAMMHIRDKVENPRFCFFSNDMPWVRSTFHEDNSIYIGEDFFDCYEDWYDMCLMSHCKHNIIANSTFSWWGAWLNRNPSKIVIAPKNWLKNEDLMQDICPPEWIRM